MRLYYFLFRNNDYKLKKPVLLIAGGSHSDIPLIKAGKKLGYHVITSGNRPFDLGHKYSDEIQLADFSDSDAILELAKKNKIDAICAGCNDFSALSCSYVAQELGLPGHDTYENAKTIHHKDKFRDFIKKIGIPSPRAIGCSSMQEVELALNVLNYPLIIKPVDLTGGKGIARVESRVEAISSAVNAFSVSKSKRIVVEEFICGSRHGFSSIIRNGRVVFHFSDDEYYHISQYLVSAASTPTSCSDRTIYALIEYCETIASTLKLVDGILHVQFIQNQFGDPYIIEICRRAPGDLYIDLVMHATGLPYAEWILRAFTGKSISDVFHYPVSKCVLRHCLMADNEGIFHGFEFDPEIESLIIDKLIWVKKGDVITDAKTHKFGIVFIIFPDKESCIDKSKNMQKYLRSIVK